MPGRRAPWRIAAASAAVLAAMGIASWSQTAGDDVRRRLGRLVAVVDQRPCASQPPRAVVWAPTTDGVAFAKYALAMAALGNLADGFFWDEKAEAPRRHGKAVDAARLAELRPQWAPALSLFGEGAHCRDVAAGRAWSLPTRPSPRQVLSVFTTEVVGLLGEGRPATAVSLWLDGLTYATDLLQDDVDFGEAEAACRFSAVWTDARLLALPATELDRLDAGLAALDPRIPTLPDHEVSLADSARSLLDGVVARARGGWTARERLAAFRSGFDVERQHLEGIEELWRLAAVLSPPAADGAARQAQWRAFRRAPRLCETWISEYADQRMQGVEHRQREALAKVRLLRLAVAFHRGVPLPDLADPFGAGRLAVALDGDKAVFRCAETFVGSERTAVRR